MTWTDTYCHKDLLRNGYILLGFRNNLVRYKYTRLKYKDVYYELYFSKTMKGEWRKYYKLSSNNNSHFNFCKKDINKLFANKAIEKTVELLNRYF